MMYKETKDVELKEIFSKTLLKTISAYANYHDGKIFIGVDDSGMVVGLKTIIDLKLDIENSINDSIIPKPRYEINTLNHSGKEILEILVFKGQDGPYYYKNKAYMRNDTSTVPVDAVNLTRLVLSCKNLSFDQLDNSNSSLKFEYLTKKLVDELKINEVNQSVLTTLGLSKNQTFNNGAVLLSDNGNLNQSYVDIAKFQYNTDIFIERMKFSNQSILKYYDESIRFFNKYYMPYQVVEGEKRISKEKVPLVAFREVLANAIVHRDYLLNNGVQIAMFDNRIEVYSPGGLPEGITKEMYFNGLTSLTRNPIISYVFFRLGIIEQFGTGIKRIINSYKKYNTYPSFLIQSSQIKIILPVLDYDYSTMNKVDAIIAYLGAYPNSSRKDIETSLNLDKSYTIRRLNELHKEHIISISGNGPSVRYTVL